MIVRARRICAGTLAAVLAGCAAAVPTPTPLATPSVPVPTPAVLPTPASESVSPGPSARPVAEARTWFAPMPYAPRGATDAIDGSADYDDLFGDDDRWPVAAGATDVVKLYSGWVVWHATEEQLRAIVASTEARGQLLALEIGSLVGTDTCGMDIEGFNASLDALHRLRALGGRVALVAFDEPYAFGHVYAGERSCRWSTQRVAEETATFVRALRAVEPDVQVGDIEPLWSDLTPVGLGEWVDAYQHAAGEPFDFVHLDVDWTSPTWQEWVAASSDEVRSRAIPLGVIYNGGDEAPDQVWLDAARTHIDAVEGVLGGRPDQVVFQSWMHSPRNVLPETNLSTFTGLVRQYATARRTSLTIESSDGGVVRGRLSGTDGSPVPGARIGVSATPLDGGYVELVASGVVPAGVTRALVGLRVNTEGAGGGSFAVYELSYTQGGSTQNLVPNPVFAAGAESWWWEGGARVRITASDRDRGRMMLVTAAPAQPLVMNGDEFAVSPGTPYALRARVRAPALGETAPQVILVFGGEAETSRVRLPILPEASAVAATLTDASGAFRIVVPSDLGRLEMSYPGDLDHWPASREVQGTTAWGQPG